MTNSLRYMPDRDQLALAGEIEGPIADLLPVARLHRQGAREPEEIWAALGELGLLAAGVSEARGGSGLSVVEQALIAVALGRALAGPAVLATIAAAPAVPGQPAEAPRIAAGLVTGAGLAWVDEPSATLVLAADGGGFALHRLPPEPREIDHAVWGARLLAGAAEAPVAVLDDAAALIVRLLLAGALAGIADGALELAVAYAKVREQFGRPIGSFQAIKHHCANMAIAALSARDLVRFAAVALADARADAAHRVECAFLTAARAAIGNAGLDIQVHGGIGFSAEADPHLFLKRAQLITALGGGVEAAAVRVAATGGAHLTA